MFDSVYAKIQKLRQGPAQLYTQKSRNSSRLLFCSVYSIGENPGSQAGPCPAVYAKIQEPRQGLVQQRIRKNPEARGGICSVAYTQKSRNLSRLLFCSVYAKIQELEQVSVLQRIQYRRKSGIPGRLLSGSVYAKIRDPRQGPAQQRIRENPEARGGICSVAYTQNPGAGQGSAQQRIRKIQEPRQAPAQLCTQKSRNLGRLLFCSVYAKFRNSSRLLFCSVYSIRKNPGAQARPCPAAYTQKSRSPGRALSSSVYLCESASITKKPGRVDLLPGFLW